MKTIERARPRQVRARVTIALAYFAAITLIVGWSLPRGAAADSPAEPPVRPQESGISSQSPEIVKPVTAAGKARRKVNCAGCGIVESMQRIDTPDEFIRWCEAGETVSGDVPGLVLVGRGPVAVESLADSVADVIADQRGGRKVAVTTRHRIVVRLPDGTRHVFDEATPRTLQVGNRIKVIAGVAGTNG
jgi:hypothetical protein